MQAYIQVLKLIIGVQHAFNHKGHVNFQGAAHYMHIHTFLQCLSCYEIGEYIKKRENYLIHVYRYIHSHTYTLYTYNDMYIYMCVYITTFYSASDTYYILLCPSSVCFTPL